MLGTAISDIVFPSATQVSLFVHSSSLYFFPRKNDILLATPFACHLFFWHCVKACVHFWCLMICPFMTLITAKNHPNQRMAKNQLASPNSWCYTSPHSLPSGQSPLSLLPAPSQHVTPGDPHTHCEVGPSTPRPAYGPQVSDVASNSRRRAGVT